jgi:hypothetical protein
VDHPSRRPPHLAPRPPGQSPSKPAASAGISQADFAALTSKVSSLEKELTEALAERNLWNTVLRKWQDDGRTIHVRLVSESEDISGTIKWVDRYTIGITCVALSTEPVIIHKGAIATIRV